MRCNKSTSRNEYIFKQVNISVIFVGVLSFGLNSAAYVSEIIRAGIESIDKGQKEAAHSLGLNYLQLMRYIILPQAIKNVLPFFLEINKVAVSYLLFSGLSLCFTHKIAIIKIH